MATRYRRSSTYIRPVCSHIVLEEEPSHHRQMIGRKVIHSDSASAHDCEIVRSILCLFLNPTMWQLWAGLRIATFFLLTLESVVVMPP